MHGIKLGFVTCVELGYACIKEIYNQGIKLDAIFTLKDEIARKKSGRVYLDKFCQSNKICLHKLENINDHGSIKLIQSYEFDWLFIIGWSQIACEEIINAPSLGVLGMHPTLLPQGRGRASIPWAILKGLDTTGVTLFKLDCGVDTGPIIDQHIIPITAKEDASTLYAKATNAHLELIKKNLKKLITQTHKPKIQNNSQATYWPGRKPEDGQITPDMRLSEIDRLVRATTTPYPGAFLSAKDGKRTIIWSGSKHKIGENCLPIQASDGIYWATRFEKTED